MNINWKSLQNGSDIRGIALEGIEGQEVNLTPEVAAQAARAFSLWLSQKCQKSCNRLRIAVGRDSRLSGPNLMKAVMDALINYGVSVYDCGMASTPAMYMSLVKDGYNYDGSIMITASHLPFNRNGLKFFSASGGLEHEDITNILKACEMLHVEKTNDIGKYKKVDFMASYARGLCRKISDELGEEKPLAGLKIIVDAGNGAGGFFAKDVLEPLGADITGSQFLEPDGSFPNHVPNPEDEQAMQSIKQAVLDNNADLGLIFDTDVDRMGAVDKSGQELNRNSLIALISAIMLEDNPATCIVTDSVTSDGLAEFIKNIGGIHYRYRRGYKNVINKAIDLNNTGIDCQVAIETSGHAALKENYFLDDGAYLAVKLIIKMAQMAKQGKQLTDLIDGLKQPKETAELRFKINDEQFKQYGEKLVEELTAYAENTDGWNVYNDNREGIRVGFDMDNGDGWFLLRLSLHDPVIPVNIESNIEGGVKTIAAKLYEFIKNYDKLDLTAIENIVK